MSFLLLAAAPLLGVSFGAGYFYGSYSSPSESLPQNLIVEIQKGVPLKHVKIDVDTKIVWTDHDALLRDINKRPVLKPTPSYEKQKSPEDIMFDELKEILKVRRQKVLEETQDKTIEDN